MPSIEFPFFQQVPTVVVNFAAPLSTNLTERRLLIDSGFTGKSALVLSHEDARLLKQRSAAGSRVAGALIGKHERIWAKCSIPSLNFSVPLMAIAGDLSRLSLPTGIDGLAGLSFLKLFERWGAEQRGGHWFFSLTLADSA